VEYFQKPASTQASGDLVFVGSMDWMPNIDGASWFVREVLPLIRKRRPDCTLTVAGRKPAAEITRLSETDPLIRVTGTVPDIRPWLWESKVSVVPLRIGGGTRLKIYEAMAARTPVVSTMVGAEGLEALNGENIWIADEPDDFAAHCLSLLDNAAERERLASAAEQMVRERYSWDVITDLFERMLVTS
jgi:glycosyltransferase involved in cell wall biosynthesis